MIIKNGEYQQRFNVKVTCILYLTYNLLANVALLTDLTDVHVLQFSCHVACNTVILFLSTKNKKSIINIYIYIYIFISSLKYIQIIHKYVVNIHVEKTRFCIYFYLLNSFLKKVNKLVEGQVTRHRRILDE